MSKNTQRQNYLHQLALRGPFKLKIKRKRNYGKSR